MSERMRAIVRQAFEESGMTYRELTACTGIDGSHLSKYLKGQVDIQTTSFEKICNALGIDIDKLKD